LSDAQNLTGLCLVGIQSPSAWTAAGLSFSVSADGSTYADLYDDAGNEVTATAAASRGIALDYSTFLGWRCLKVRSGTNGTPVNQGGDRALTLVCRPI
jgi:hypothetical protein